MKFVAAILILLVVGTHAANYAVLVAGSNGYGNYRHQSDVCHAFHILTDLGQIPAQNIIVFMYDDIANNPSNPFKGNMINKPNGTNYYPGVNHDYIGQQVTPDNFIYAITGDHQAKGPILRSGPDDNVFIYYTDHGGAGLVAFPVGGYLYADRLNAALKTMHSKGMYKKLVFYLEACESGSMFEKLLPSDLDIFATTASTASQSSYACYYDTVRKAYLGDEYSVRWMEDSDEHDKVTPSPWTLEDQFKLTCKETTMSQPQQYGDMSMQEDDITLYQSQLHSGKLSESKLDYIPCFGAASRDVPVALLQKRLEEASNDKEKLEAAEALQAELASRRRWDWTMDELVTRVVGNAKASIFSEHAIPKNFDCLRGAVDNVEKVCGKFTEYSLKWVYTLVNMCEAGKSVQSIAEAASYVCAN